MARYWITGLIVIVLVGTIPGTSEAQTGATKKSMPLSARLAQMRDALRGKSSKDEPGDGIPAFITDQHETRQPTAAANSRSQPAETLPRGLFGRQADQSDGRDVFLDDNSDLDLSPRAGTVSGLSQVETARRSPAKKEYNELREALADLSQEQEPFSNYETDGPYADESSEGDDAYAEELSGIPAFLAGEDPVAPSYNDQVMDDQASLPELADNETLTDEERLARLAQQRRVPRVSRSGNQQFDLHRALVRDSSETNNTSAPSQAVSEPVAERRVADSLQKRRDFTDKLKNFPGEEDSAKPPLQVDAAGPPAETSIADSPHQAKPHSEQLPERVTLSSQQPMIVSHIEGPRQVLVGQEATFRVTLENTSDAVAQRLLAEIRLPDDAEVVEATCSSGTVERNDAAEGNLKWQLQEIGSRKSQTLTVRLVPRSGQPMHLGVEWTQAPITSQALVEVQEPKVNVAISGPGEVLFGKPQRFRLTLSNPGTGVADNVVIQLTPPGGDENSKVTHPVGALKPGENRDIELELTAREAGDLLMAASATANGGLHAEATKQIVCKKPELQIDWRGTEQMYAGTSATYFIRVRNPGTATTEDVTVRVALPHGAKFETASEGHKFDAKSSTVAWKLKGIAPEENDILQVRCQIDRAGKNEIAVTAETASGELSESSLIATNVVALADLKLTVVDPSGPMPVGEEVVYEVRVINRGTTDAENVNVVGLFSEGIDPTKVEGAEFSVRDGRVAINPIKSLPAGHELVVKILAVASEEGTHIFRAEVSCQDLDVKLASEETTRFYKEEFSWGDGETPYTADQGSKTLR